MAPRSPWAVPGWVLRCQGPRWEDRLNSTLKSIVFWVAVVVVAALVYSITKNYGNAHKLEDFSQFMVRVDDGEVDKVTFTGNEVTYVTKPGETFRSIAPSGGAQYEGLSKKLIERGITFKVIEPAASPWTNLLYSWAP